MILIAALFTGVGLAATFWRQSQEADELDARIAEMSAQASRVRQIADRASKESRLLAILHEMRRRNALITELWEEVSRLMPDSAFLTDFRLGESKAGERSVELTGFAQSAVGLPLLFDQSKYFSEATLTAPITYDPKDKRESFSLRLRARAPVPVAATVDSVSGNDRPTIAEPPR
jgi:general secretion pathway protein L